MYRQHYPNDPGMHTPAASSDRGRRDYDRSSYPASLPDSSRGSTFLQHLCSSAAIPSLVGCLLVTASLGMLSWNERRAVRIASSLDEGIKSVQVLPSTDVTFDELNGHLVYCQGRLTCRQVVSDNEYGVVVSAAKLRRTVEMYQWVESQHGDERDNGVGAAEGTVTYSYDKRWSEELVPSSAFYSLHVHRNPETMSAKSATFVSAEVFIGNIFLSPGLVDQVSAFHDITLKELPENRNDVQLVDGYYYHGHGSPATPEIGDMRLRYSYAGSCFGEGAATVSVIAKQSGRSLGPYQTYAGGVIEILSEGSHTVQELFSRSYVLNTMQLLALRAFGWIVSFAGFTCLPPSFAITLSRVPLGRDLAAMGRATMNSGLATSVTLVAIAVFWLLHRPWFCAAALALAALPVLLPRLVSRLRRPGTLLRR